MLNLLIANKNLRNLQSLQNYISQYIPDIRVGFLAEDGKAALDALNQYHYDILLLDSKLAIYDGFDILQKISDSNQMQYEKSIIFLSQYETMVKNLKNHFLVYDAFLNTDTLSKILSSLKKLADSKRIVSMESYTKAKIINELQTIGFNLSHNGTHYLAESVLLIAQFNYDAENLTKNIYPKVSQIYNKSLNNIKTNIITATDAACKNINPVILKKYLKLSDNVKPTAKMIIYSILQKL